MLLIALLLLTVTAALSIAIGSNQIPLLRTVELLFVPDSSFESTVVHVVG